jgi:hypothetical protein
MLGCGIVARVSERLFTMLDKTGDEQINYREFIVGVSPMITGDGEFSCPSPLSWAACHADRTTWCRTIRPHP